jgi:hypothetical protein
MIEWVLIGCFVGFALPFLVRNRVEIMEFMRINVKKVKKD